MNSRFSRSNQSLENLPGKQDCQPIKHAPRHASLWASVSLIWCSLQKDEAKFSERETETVGNQEKLASGQEATEIMIIFGLSQIKMKYHTLHFYRSCSGHILLLMLNVGLVFKLKSWALRVQSSLLFHFFASINHQLPGLTKEATEEDLQFLESVFADTYVKISNFTAVMHM